MTLSRTKGREEFWECQVWQDGIMVASGIGFEHDAKREAIHYAMMYLQDGPVQLRMAPLKKKKTKPHSKRRTKGAG